LDNEGLVYVDGAITTVSRYNSVPRVKFMVQNDWKVIAAWATNPVNFQDKCVILSVEPDTYTNK